MTTKSSLYCNWEMMKPYDGIHFEEMLPLTKAHLFCLGALVVLGPASSFQYCLFKLLPLKAHPFLPCVLLGSLHVVSSKFVS